MQKCNIDPTVLYGIFESTRKNDVNDLTLGLATYQKEHPEKNIDSGLAQEIRLFFGRGHDKTLSKAFPNLADFYIAFGQCLKADEEWAKEKEQKEKDAATESAES